MEYISMPWADFSFLQKSTCCLKRLIQLTLAPSTCSDTNHNYICWRDVAFLTRYFHFRISEHTKVKMAEMCLEWGLASMKLNWNNTVSKRECPKPKIQKREEILIYACLIPSQVLNKPHFFLSFSFIYFLPLAFVSLKMLICFSNSVHTSNFNTAIIS